MRALAGRLLTSFYDQLATHVVCCARRGCGLACCALLRSDPIDPGTWKKVRMGFFPLLVASSALTPQPRMLRTPALRVPSPVRCSEPLHHHHRHQQQQQLLLQQLPPQQQQWQPQHEDATALGVGFAVSISLLALVTSVEPVSAAGSAAAAAVALPPSAIFEKAAKRALGGGISGFLAGIAQVLLLMWLRTTMNYQYRNGGSARDAFDALYAEGGPKRFYQGVSFALVQTPLSRFGDTAANSGMLVLLADSSLPIGVRTAFASAAAAAWRIGLTPLDTMKTTLQVTGAEGYGQVKAKIDEEGPTVLFQGALANAAASFAGNYPWYLTFNSLNEMLPSFGDDLPLKLARTAVLGISAAAVSDCVSNSIRVLKTTRQTSAVTISYREAAQQVIEADGWRGLFGRGLGTRLATNALQAALFTVVWKVGEEYLTNSGVLG